MVGDGIHPRSREVVKLAADRTKIGAIRMALFNDGNGVFERAASKLLNNETARALMVEKGLTEDNLVDEAADVLLLSALEAAARIKGWAT